MHPSLALSLVALLAILVATAVPAAGRLLSSPPARYHALNPPDEADDYYATAATAPDDHIPRLFAAACSVLGLIVSVFNAFWTASPASWVQAAGWLLILVQCLMLLAEKSPPRRFGLGIVIAVSAALLLVSEGAAVYQRFSSAVGQPALIPLYATEVSLVILTIISSCSLPRRPSAFRHGRVVDPQNSVSALQRYTFAWAGPILDLGKAGSRIAVRNLPILGRDARAVVLQDRLYRCMRAGQQPLWMSIYKSHERVFQWQWFLTFVQSVFSYAPQVCIYNLLTLLEQRDSGSPNRSLIWVWALALGVSSLFSQVLGARLTWISFATLEVQVRSQLSATLFEKALRMDDVKDDTQQNEIGTAHSGNADEEGSGSEGDVSDEGEDEGDAVPLMKLDKKNTQPGKPGEKIPITKGESTEPRAKQQILNLIAVDAQRIAEMSSRHNVFLGTFVTFVIAIFFLVRLIGWVSFTLGLLGPLMFIPLNMMASKAYGGAQAGVMKARDEKLKVVTEALKGIKQIKFTATERRWQSRIMALRKEELMRQRSAFIWTICLRFFWHSSPIVLAVVALSVYSWINGFITPSVAFTALGVFANLEWCVSIIPMATMQLLDARISASRIEKFLKGPEKKQTTVAGDNVGFKDATVAWPTAEEPGSRGKRYILKGVSIEFPSHELSVVHGQSGSGKSLLLASIIGEAEVVSGTVTVPRPPIMRQQPASRPTRCNWIIPDSRAFVSQIPWIENASIKNNILFGLPFDPDRYRDVLEASALIPDLEMFIDGDMTEVGAQGINLSGGQRWRLTFARALYSRAELLVLDDIFSAVDSHVGVHLLKGLTGSLCQGRTRILATHHAALCLPKAAYAVHLGRGGHIDQTTTFTVHQRLMADWSEGWHVEKESILPVDSKDANMTAAKHQPLQNSDDQAGVPDRKPKAFVEEEQREEGAIKWRTYKQYLTSSGGLPTWILAVSMVVLSQLALFGRAWWIKLWTESNGGEAHNRESKLELRQTDPHSQSHGLVFYLGLYVLISVAAALMEAVKCSVVYAAALRASRTLFYSLLHTVLRSKLRWLDTVPAGRILNRFTADFALIDTRIPGDTHTFFSAVFGLCVIFTAGMLLSPYMAISSAALFLITLLYTARYLHGAREIRRLESTTKSPVMELCGTTMVGLGTIRAFGVLDTYRSRMASFIDDCSSSSETFWLVTQWLALRMGVLGSLFALSVAITIACLINVKASLAGFALSFALDYTKNMEEAVRRFANLQLDMSSTERVVEFSEMESESEAGMDPPEGWPPLGKISFQSLEAGYAPDLPPVLKGFTAEFGSRQRIGIVGRTGAGKSSLALAIFRFIEPTSGMITIDGLNISGIKIGQLRSKMAIISQDPVLFSGTVRSNLDPFGEHTDAELCTSLKRVHLVDVFHQKAGAGHGGLHTNINVFEDLDSPISEGGLNLSQGQRQLLCLARAILTRSRIMVMDEATSAVDRTTDELIQRSIREEFTQSTLIVIAHRLSTVADFDRILVMADGQAVEFGEPSDLFSRKGPFWKLVAESGDRDDLVRVISA